MRLLKQVSNKQDTLTRVLYDKERYIPIPISDNRIKFVLIWQRRPHCFVKNTV
jgi:hypothetical protein